MKYKHQSMHLHQVTGTEEDLVIDSNLPAWEVASGLNTGEIVIHNKKLVHLGQSGKIVGAVLSHTVNDKLKGWDIITA